MIRLACVLTIVFGVSFGFGSRTASAQPSNPDTVSLFDGQSLSGWSGDPKFWRVEDGAITGQTTKLTPTNGNTFCIWEGEVDDFELTRLSPVATSSSDEVTDLPVIFEEDFENGLDRWELIDPESWKLEDHGKGQSLSIIQRESAYEPKVRSPRHIALIKDVEADSFELTFKVKSTKNTGNHRDCCVFFNYQDPTHFYYVHLGAKPDPASGQIMIVNDAPRAPLTENKKNTPWSESGWHTVKLVRNFADGNISVYFDNLETPHMTVNDKTFGKGRIGIGSFDDMDAFDEIELRAESPGDREADFKSIFNGKNLDGWEQVNGTASYEVVDGAILGTTATGSPNSFLATKKPYANFELEFDVFLVDNELNSGVQFRSAQHTEESLATIKKKHPVGRVYGYQCEIEASATGDLDPKKYGDAGYIYDEARRGWLVDDETRIAATTRNAFQNQAWNKMRIRAEGDHIQTWINDVKICDLNDDLSASGFIALQVHGIGKRDEKWQVKWKNIRIKELPVNGGR